MDSFYEYLLKYWLLTGKQDKTHHSMYKKAVEGIKEHLIANVDGKKYLISKSFGESIMQIEHLACFAPGMLGLGAHNEGDDELLKLAEELTETCYLTYHNQGTQGTQVLFFIDLCRAWYWMRSVVGTEP